VAVRPDAALLQQLHVEPDPDQVMPPRRIVAGVLRIVERRDPVLADLVGVVGVALLLDPAVIATEQPLDEGHHRGTVLGTKLLEDADVPGIDVNAGLVGRTVAGQPLLVVQVCDRRGVEYGVHITAVRIRKDLRTALEERTRDPRIELTGHGGNRQVVVLEALRRHLVSP
jgi:hypothetical protein